MSSCRAWSSLIIGLAFLLMLSAGDFASSCQAQSPTIEETGTNLPGGLTTAPGSLDSLLGMFPGSGNATFGIQPGRDDLLLGRIGTAAPRVPTAITMPGGTYQGPRVNLAIAATQPIPAARPLLYGSLEVPEHATDEGPADGLTLDQAIDLLVHQNLDLRAKQLEIPQARRRRLDGKLACQPDLLRGQSACPVRVGFASPPRRTNPV